MAETRIKRGVIDLVVEGADGIVGAGGSIVDSFSRVKDIVGQVKAAFGEIRDAYLALMDIAQGAAEDEGVTAGFAGVVGGMANVEAATATLRTATRGMIEDTDLQRQANQAQIDELGVSLESWGALERVVIQAGRAMGSEPVDSGNALAKALGDVSERQLKQLGITVDLEEATKRYADAHGIASSEVDRSTKRMILYDEIVNSLVKDQDKLSATSTPVADSFAQLQTKFANFWSSVQVMIAENPSFMKSLHNLADAAISVGTAIAGVVADLSPFLEMLSKIVKVVAELGSLLINASPLALLGKVFLHKDQDRGPNKNVGESFEVLAKEAGRQRADALHGQLAADLDQRSSRLAMERY